MNPLLVIFYGSLAPALIIGISLPLALTYRKRLIIKILWTILGLGIAIPLMMFLMIVSME